MSHRVVRNDDGQYSTWPDHKELPAGWNATGFAGSQDECLDHISQVWTDLSPRGRQAAERTNTLSTERLVLRELTTEQVTGLLKVLHEGTQSDEYVEGYPLAGSGFAAQHFTERTPEELRFGFGMYVIVPRPGELVAGDIGFHRPPKDGVVEIGFGMVETARGKGYATDAVRALCQWALAQPGVSRVVARTTADNAGALGVLRRVGFRLDHTSENFQHHVLLPAPALPQSEPMRDDEAEHAAIKKLGKVRKAGGDDLAFVPGSNPLRRVVRDGERLLAYAQSGDKLGVEAPGTHLMYIVVHPIAARRGLATSLLAEVRDHARAHGKVSLVTGTPDEDHPSVAWVRKQGFEPIGHHRITRRERGAAGADVPADLVVETVDRAVSAEVDEFVDLATRTVAEAVMPGGARMTSDPAEIRKDLVDGGNGELLVCRISGRAVGWLALTPLVETQDGFVLAVQVLEEAAGRGVPGALLDAAARLADQAGAATLTAVAEEEGQRELAAALPDHGFHQVGGRTIWSADVDPATAKG